MIIRHITIWKLFIYCLIIYSVCHCFEVSSYNWIYFLCIKLGVFSWYLPYNILWCVEQFDKKSTKICYIICGKWETECGWRVTVAECEPQLHPSKPLVMFSDHKPVNNKPFDWLTILLFFGIQLDGLSPSEETWWVLMHYLCVLRQTLVGRLIYFGLIDAEMVTVSCQKWWGPLRTSVTS